MQVIRMAGGEAFLRGFEAMKSFYLLHFHQLTGIFYRRVAESYGPRPDHSMFALSRSADGPTVRFRPSESHDRTH